MCGIAAAYAYSQRASAIDREELRAVRDFMSARGPDGEGEWFSGDARVGLAHRRLAIIDLSPGGAQPMATPDGRLTITFNGEIYNYRELRAELEGRGCSFRTSSDTEIILRLYELEGTRMLTRLRGMFAFVLWDARERELLLARDTFGIKPLFYSDDGRTLRAASQVKALLRADVDKSADPAGHAGFYLWGSVPAPWTLYRGIRSLPAGHFMKVREEGADDPQPFCEVTTLMAEAVSNPAQGTRAQAIEAIAAALSDSVRAHHVADVPVGVFLSAGLDSGMLACLTSSAGMDLRTLTLGFEEYAGTPDDEAPEAQAIAQMLGARHDTIRVRRSDFRAERARLLAAMDQPSIDGVNTWFVARAAASQGFKVALSGLGGDEILASYPSFRQVPALASALRPLGYPSKLGIVVRKLTEPLVRRVTSPKYAGLLEYGGSMGGAYLLRRGLYMPWELPHLMDPDMAQQGWSQLQAVARLDDTVRKAGAPRNDRLAMSALEMSWYMRHQLLADADWAGMAHSLEIRVPFVDVPFIRAAAPWFAAHPHITKAQVAQAAAPRLPPHLLERPKTGFSVPVRQWLGATSTSTRGLRTWARQVHRAATSGSAPRVLISTLAPGNGGVHAMTRFVLRALSSRGLQPVIAHYAPYSMVPRLSVPSFRLLQRSVGEQVGRSFDERECHAIGAWLPELEFTHYLATDHWRRIMDSCDAHMVVSGNVLAATPYWQTGRPYVAWVATDWDGDRKDRVRKFPLARRIVDTSLTKPVVRWLERHLLRSGVVLPLSRYTQATLRRVAGAIDGEVLPMGVDCKLFTPQPAARVAGRTGFVGRFNDPRKNVELYLQCVAKLRAGGVPATGVLVGDSPTQALRDLVAQLGLEPHVELMGTVAHHELPDLVRTLDVFVLPSHQEGLCIAALEAMACGVPVVSTRCGGPEEFIIEDETGMLVDFDAGAMAQAVATLLSDTGRRDRLGRACRELVERRYSITHAESVLWHALDQTFPGLAAPAATAT